MFVMWAHSAMRKAHTSDPAQNQRGRDQTLTKNVEFSHTGTQLTFKGLPTEAPDEPVTVIAIEFDSEPRQKSLAGRVIDIITEIEKKQHPAGPE